MSETPTEHMREAVADFVRRRGGEGAETLDVFLSTTGFAHDAVARVLRELEPAVGQDAETGPEEHFGRYRIRALLGTGGMGTVHLAHDSQLGRDVALKRIRPDLLISAEARRRFESETAAVARLDHPNVCRVFDAGEHDGQPFLVLQYVRGESLATRLQGAGRNGSGPAGVTTHLSVEACLLQIEKVARALHHAHGHGIVHRDVKPSNILIDGSGEPFLIDFGLARPLQGNESLTAAGATPGTFRYMSPEQLGGRGGELDGRSDVFSLALVLAEALTLQHPFAAGSEIEWVHGILHAEPSLQARSGRQLSSELRVVLKTALTKARSRRYPTAAAFADDLARLRRHEPIQAVRPSRARAARLWVRRHPVATMGAGLLLTATVLASFLAQEARARARESSQHARVVEATLRAHAAVHEPAAALRRAVEAADINRPHAFDTVLWQRLDACGLAYSFPRTVDPARGSLLGTPALDSSGERMAFLTELGDLRVRRVADGAEAGSVRAHAGGVSSRGGTTVAFRPQSQELFTGGNDGVVKTWRTDTWQEIVAVRVAEPSEGAHGIEAVAVSADGRWLAAGDDHGRLLLKDLRSGRERRLVVEPNSSIGACLFAPTASALLVSCNAPTDTLGEFTTLAVVDVESGATRWWRRFPTDAVASSQWHPSDRWIVAGTLTGEVMVLAAADGSLVSTRSHANADPYVRWCGFDPSGQLVLAGVSPGIRVFDFAEGVLTERATIVHAHRRSMVAAAFDRTGRLVATQFRDGSVAVVSTATWSILQAFAAPPYCTGLQSMHWAPGRLVAARNHDIQVWHAPPRGWLPQLFPHAQAINTVDVHPDGEWVLTASDDGRICLTSLVTGAVREILVGAPVISASFAADGGRFLVADAAGQLGLYDLKGTTPTMTTSGSSGEFLDADRLLVVDGETLWKVQVADGARSAVREHTGAIRALAVDRERGKSFTGGDSREVWITSLEDPRVAMSIHTVSMQRYERGSLMDSVSAVAWAARSQLLLVSVRNHMMSVTPMDGRSPPRFVHMDRFGGLIAIDPNERHAVFSDFGFGRITWLDLQTLDTTAMVLSDVHTQAITAVRFSRSGRLCLTASLDGTVQVWDAATRTIRSILSLDGTTVHDACFSPDEAWVVTGDGRGQVKAWPIDPLSAAKAYLRGLDESGR